MNACHACNSTNLSREEADVGVGIIYGPWHCLDCGWREPDLGLLPEGPNGECPICGGIECKPGCGDGSEVL